MYIKDFVKELLPIQNLDNLYIVADFDYLLRENKTEKLKQYGKNDETKNK